MADRPRLIELAPFAREDGGSFVLMLGTLAREAVERGWTIEFVLPSAAREHEWVRQLRFDGTTIHFMPELRRRERMPRLRSLVGDQGGPVVMHSHFTTWDIPVALLSSPRQGRHGYWHVHTILRRRPLAVARNVAKFTALARRLDGVICFASNMAHELHARGVPKGRIEVVPSGIDADQFPLLDVARRAEARRRLDIAADAEVLLHFGWDWRIKGGDLFLQAVADLLGSGRDRVLALAQRGGDPAKNAVRELGIADHVRVIDRVPDVTDLFGAADVFLAVSAREGMPYSVLESICCGTPVVASDLPGHAAVGDAVPACQLVARDPRTIADAVREFLDAPEGERAANAATSREWVTDNLSASSAARHIIELFDFGLSRRRK